LTAREKDLIFSAMFRRLFYAVSLPHHSFPTRSKQIFIARVNRVSGAMRQLSSVSFDLNQLLQIMFRRGF
jgi:hypothetical protein